MPLSLNLNLPFLSLMESLIFMDLKVNNGEIIDNLDDFRKAYPIMYIWSQ